MNDRIKELAKQAAKEMNETGTYTESKFQEKFAELIIQECINSIVEIAPGYMDYRNQIEERLKEDCICEIKHKFGLKNE